MNRTILLSLHMTSWCVNSKSFVFSVHNKHRNAIIPSYDFSLTIATFRITKDSTVTGGISRFLHRSFVLLRSLWHESRSYIQIPAFCNERLPWLLASVAANARNVSGHHTLPPINRTEFSNNSLIPRNVTSYAGHTLSSYVAYGLAEGIKNHAIYLF